MAATTGRPYQIVVWGASGFTGRLVCEHLVRDYKGRVQWAMAGRDRAKLEGVRAELAKIDERVKDVPVLVADARDEAQVAEVLKQTQVVLSTAGPFSLYGDKVVEQSVAQRTHYLDITGEVPWVKRSMAKHHAEAERQGVRIVHCCGYDSVPSDLGALMMVEHLRARGKKTAKVTTLVGPGRGGASGGTIASAFTIVEREPVQELMAAGRDAYYLPGGSPATAPGLRRGTAKPSPSTPVKEPVSGDWCGPFIMEGVNGRIVQMSAALASPPYGSDFQYDEVVATGKGWSGWAGAWAVSLGMGLIGISLALSPVRSLLKRVLPAPGQGPSYEAQRTGFWTHNLVAVAEQEPGSTDPPLVVKGVCGDKRDPGYWSTSRMLLEAGLCLVLDADKLDKTKTRPGGVLTPAAAFGMTLVQRLRAAGFTWEVEGGR